MMRFDAWGWIAPNGAFIEPKRNEEFHEEIAQRLIAEDAAAARAAALFKKRFKNGATQQLLDAGYVRVSGKLGEKQCAFEVVSWEELNRDAREAVELFSLRERCSVIAVDEVANSYKTKYIDLVLPSGLEGLAQRMSRSSFGRIW